MKVFLFDLDDTLYNQLLPFETAYDMVFGERFELDVHKLYVGSRRHGDDVFEASERGEMSMDDMHVYRLSMAFRDFGIEITREEALWFQREYAKAQKNIYLSETMESLLQELKDKGHRLGVISNGPAAHQRKKIQALCLERWIPGSDVYISGELDLMKPDRRIFDYVIKDMKVAGMEIYYVGDSFANDIAGAKGADLLAVWMNRRNHAMPKDSVIPDYQVHTEEELKELLTSL